MLRLCGCDIGSDDADWLIAALRADGSHSALDTAAAVRWGADLGLAATDLEPDIRGAILKVLDNPAPDLVNLRAALLDTTRPAGVRKCITSRFHNPKRRDCGCLSDCWCKRTAWGRALRWYVPQRHHTSVSPCWTCAKQRTGEPPIS